MMIAFTKPKPNEARWETILRNLEYALGGAVLAFIGLGVGDELGTLWGWH